MAHPLAIGAPAPAPAPILAVADGLPSTRVFTQDLLDCERRAKDVRTLLGCIARMAAPGDAELTAAIALARQISDELTNDLSVLTEEV